jgi:Ca2+-transporting ATPase
MGLAAALLAGCALMASQGWPAASMRTAAFLALVAGLFLLVPAQREPSRAAGRAPNPWFWRLALGVVLVTAALLAVPWLRRVMGFELPDAPMLVAVAMMVAGTTAWLAISRRVPHLRRTFDGGRSRR